jgi:hypothetical protein
VGLCGNGVCEPGEDMKSCPKDCPVGPVCGNGVCEVGEDMKSCPKDCTGPVCGNGVCEVGEDMKSCPKDCLVVRYQDIGDNYPGTGGPLLG